MRGVLGRVRRPRPRGATRSNRELFRLWDEGRIAPKVSATFPLERGGEAIAMLGDRRAIGKVVVSLD